ncbi:anillin isoform X2 [Periplaneta americana]|uniref:anillin isoform X2 n=1 Tax=Periplaneta americana TaxID=6978 RepID=UPI0037E90D2E
MDPFTQRLLEKTTARRDNFDIAGLEATKRNPLQDYSDMQMPKATTEDTFTQRMLARSKARREKLDPKTINAGLENKRNPLEDYNRMQLVKVTTEVELTLSKSDEQRMTRTLKVTPTKIDSVNIQFKKDKEETSKENFEVVASEKKTECANAIRDSARSRLQRLGALYADTQLSSPIHKTEGSFSAEQDEGEEEETQQVKLKSGKSGVRLARFALLADTIKHWEDDLSHPSVPSSRYGSNPDKENTIEDDSDSSNEEKTENIKTGNSNVPTKQYCKSTSQMPETKRIVWDENTIANLGDGSRDKKSSSASPSTNKGLPKMPTVLEDESTVEQNTATLESVQAPEITSAGTNHLSSNSCTKVASSPEKRNIFPKPIGSPRAAGIPQMGLRVGSPHRDASPKTGSVLHRAAIFESSNTSPTKKGGKDPAELPVSERMALFERNKGKALVPKAAFSMPVPAKYLGGSNETDKTHKNDTVKATAAGKGNRFVDNMVAQLEKPVTAQGQSGDTTKKVMPFKKSPGEDSKAVENVPKMDIKPSIAEEVAASGFRNDIPARSSKALAKLFEKGNAITSDNDILKNVQTERQKEMEMLLNRWNKNKQLSSGDENTDTTAKIKEQKPPVKQESSGPPCPPPLPTPADLSPAQIKNRAAQLSPVKPRQDPCVSAAKQSPQKTTPSSKSPKINLSSEKKHKAQSTNQQYAGLTDVKRIKVSPPKPGRLYPCLSDIEATTETESEMQDDCNLSLSDEMDSSGGEKMGDTSFGREILQAAGLHKSPESMKQGRRACQADSSDDESDTESAVLEEIDDFLDEALGDDSDSDASPSPPKKTKDNTPQEGKYYSSPSTSHSHSFKYSRGSPAKGLATDSTPKNVEHIPSYVVEGNEEVPLMHTVSFYRRQQNMAVKGTPVRQITRHPEPDPGKILNTMPVEDDVRSVRNKISELVDEVAKQQTVISQASQALNLCCSTVEFSGSAEEVEGERLLLVATHRRQAAMHEVQRLKVEGSLKPGGHSSELTDRGALVISNITLPLKKDYLRRMAADEMCHHFVCLARAQEQVAATPVMAASSENLRKGGGAALIFPGSLRLEGLYSDFKVTLEIYNLQTHMEVLPHDVKYHISGKKDGNTNKLRLTPKKLLKQESRLVMPSVQSPAGPSAVRTPAFQLSGYVVFSLRELRRTQFTLNKVAYSSPLEGNIQLQLSSELQLDVGERGFLTMFEDVSGFGAWHRRWCLLEGATLSYWKYPDDEKKKVPIGQIDLNMCTTETVGLVSRDICARPHTFLLETTRPSQPEDEDSLVLVRRGSQTTIRHLLSADTREERLQWCAQLNKALAMLRAWGSKSSRM